MRWFERLIILALTILALFVLFRLPFGRRDYHGPDAWDGQPAFVAERAWNDVQTLAVQFPRRWSGGPDRLAAADWLADGLREIGLQVRRQTFPAALGESAPIVLENVWGISPGRERPNEIIVALGNYDMAPTSFQAASDTAGHVGTILELARIIHGSSHRRTFIFLFPDGEEWGMLGARHFARTFPERSQIVAALSIEDLDPGRLRALGIDGIGQFSGFAPMWLRSLAANAADREGYPTDEVPPLVEWFQRALLVSATDQGPFLGAGIPAIDLAGRTHDQLLKDTVYHLPSDTIEKMLPGSVLAYGRLQERIVRALDLMPDVPHESGSYLRLNRAKIVSSPGLWLAQILVFVPLLVSVVTRLRGGVGSTALLRESISIGVILAVLLVCLGVVKLLPLIGVMPNYELYPPPPRHPLLTTVLWGPVLLSITVLTGVVLAANRLLRNAPGSGVGDSAQSVMATSLLWLVVVAGAALLDNPFAAVSFLLLPSLLWIWVTPKPGAFYRLGNGLLIVAGYGALIFLFVQYAAGLRVGWYILWYIFMGVAYGQFSILRIVLALATAAIALRLFARGVFKPPILNP